MRWELRKTLALKVTWEPPRTSDSSRLTHHASAGTGWRTTVHIMWTPSWSSACNSAFVEVPPCFKFAASLAATAFDTWRICIHSAHLGATLFSGGVVLAKVIRLFDGTSRDSPCHANARYANRTVPVIDYVNLITQQLCSNYSSSAPCIGAPLTKGILKYFYALTVALVTSPATRATVSFKSG